MALVPHTTNIRLYRFSSIWFCVVCSDLSKDQICHASAELSGIKAIFGRVVLVRASHKVRNTILQGIVPHFGSIEIVVVYLSGCCTIKACRQCPEVIDQFCDDQI